jgi:putative intracellular protease/amidase
MQNLRVLLVVTSANQVKGLPDPTGSWLEEVAAPYYTFRDAKCEVTIASPKGGNAPIDATSLKPENLTAATRRFEMDAEAKNALQNTVVLSTVDASQFDGIFFSGGHGTMEDFPIDASVKNMVEQFYEAQKPLSAVCHGPTCFVNAVKKNGEPLMKGHRFTCFTDAEETAVGLDKLVPFMLEATLKKQGGIPDVTTLFAEKLVVDHHVITGQNPASAIATAEAVIHQMRARRANKAAA